MDHQESASVSFEELAGTPLGSIDLLGRQRWKPTGAKGTKGIQSAFARIERNKFKFKSLSCWSYNISVGCRHGCRFCYVVSSQHTRPGKKQENLGPLATSLREFGVLDPDLDWGKYVLFRPWDEKKFMASLRTAEKTPLSKLNADGNRAVIFCSTTDPYQTIVIKDDPQKQNLLNHHARFLVRRALELILEHSTLNVRILTRSPLAIKDFDLYKQFGNRLIFGMSIPTLRQDLLDVYEPQAPGAQARLRTLRAAAEKEIPLFVAVAPTYPDLGDDDIREVLMTIKSLHPLTIFHEPINIRAENVERIAAHAKELGVPVRTDVFANASTWRNYAVDQLRAVQRIARELEIEDHLHLWPDKTLRTEQRFLNARREAWKAANPNPRETTYQRRKRREADGAEYLKFSAWLAHWHQRISEWPGKKPL